MSFGGAIWRKGARDWNRGMLSPHASEESGRNNAAASAAAADVFINRGMQICHPLAQFFPG